MSHVVIIGNGISGITTARNIRKKSNFEITVISSETEYFFSRTALMYIYMGHMKFEHTLPYEKDFWKKNRINLVFQHVENVDFNAQNLLLANGEKLNYNKLVIATGSKPNKFGWPGQDLKGVQGLYSKQDLDLMEQNSKNLQRAVVVGGGLIGVEMAEMFHSRHIPVTFLVRENSFWNRVLPAQESEMVNKHLLENGIDLRLNTELDTIIGDETGCVKAVKTKKEEEISCGFVGLTVGVSPNIDFVRNTELEIDRGILINEKQETNLPNVYAVGDCAQHRNPPFGRTALEQIWYTGKIQGENCAKNICGIPTEYNPGIYFNSAKFFDIEYQVYGFVPTTFSNEIQSIFWQHKDQKKSIRLVFNGKSRQILGFNLMGIRYRHQICEKWIREKTPIEKVIKNLTLANFDPEFHKRYEKEIQQVFESQSQNQSQSQPY